MKQNEKIRTKVKINLSIIDNIISWILCLGILISTLSFITADFLANSETAVFIILGIAGVISLIFALFFQKNNSNDKTKFYTFSLVTAVIYLAVISIYAIYFYTKGELAISAYWYRAILALNFIAALIFWNKSSITGVHKTPMNVLIYAVSLTSFYFIIVNLFGLKSTTPLNKDMISILSAGVLAVTIFQQAKLSTKTDKLISFIIFVINSLAILLAQNFIALFTLTFSVFVASLLEAIANFRKNKLASSFFPLIINSVVTFLLFITYYVISTDFDAQILRLKSIDIVVSIDTIVIFVISAVFIGKSLMKAQVESNLAILVILLSSLFMPIGEFIWYILFILLASNIATKFKEKDNSAEEIKLEKKAEKSIVTKRKKKSTKVTNLKR
jgi:hypothetical protein